MKAPNPSTVPQSGQAIAANNFVTPVWQRFFGQLNVQVSFLLDNFAQASSLAQVAKTGSYSDLSGAPTLGTMAAQDSSSINVTGGSLNTVDIHNSVIDSTEATLSELTFANLNAFTSPTATGGTGIALPLSPKVFWTVTINSTVYQIPLY